MNGINYREGKTGSLECVHAIALALTVSGLFSFESADLYAKGNSTYLSLPLGILLAFLVFALCAFAIKKGRTSELKSFVSNAVGESVGSIVCVYFIAIIIAYTCILLNRFLNILYSYFYQDSNYYAIAAYMLVVIVVLAVMGLETINRTMRIAAVVFVLTLVLLFVNSSSGYQSYKLYPIAGDGIASMSNIALQSVGCFLPALLIALITAKGAHGIGNTSKNAAKAVISAVVICFASQLLLSLSYTYAELSKLYLPLYRMSLVTGVENFAVRLDKLSAFIWSAAALLASAYYLYGASLLYCRTFKQHDIRPAVLGIGFIIVILCIVTHSGHNVLFRILTFVGKYGTYFVCAPLIAISIISILKSTIKEKKKAVG